MSSIKCGCVYADRSNTAAVAEGYDRGGYLKYRCVHHEAAQERRALVIAERIAQADSYLHDVNLPSYGELVQALRVEVAYIQGNPTEATEAILARLEEVKA